MSTKIVDIRDMPRGTTPPFPFKATKDGQPFPLVGCTIAMVVRDEAWEDSMSDENARIKRRATFWQVSSLADLGSLAGMRAGDIAWATEEGIARLYDGDGWVEANSNENRILEGIYTIRLTRQETMLPVGKYYYSVDIRLPNGEVRKVVKGTIKITDNTVNEI